MKIMIAKALALIFIKSLNNECMTKNDNDV